MLVARTQSQDSKGASTFRVKFDIGEHSEEAVLAPNPHAVHCILGPAEEAALVTSWCWCYPQVPENMHLHQSVVKTLRAGNLAGRTTQSVVTVVLYHCTTLYLQLAAP